MMTRFVRNQLIIFTIASIVGVGVMLFTYMQVPTLLGLGRINVTLQLPAAGGLYNFANVTYRGVEVGKVTDVKLTDDRRGSDADPGHVAEDSRRPAGRGPKRLRGGRAVRGPASPHRLGSVPEGRLGDRKGEHHDPAGSRPDARSGEQAGEQHSGGPDLGSAGRVVQGVQRRRPGFPVAAGLRFQDHERRQQRVGSGEGSDR